MSSKNYLSFIALKRLINQKPSIYDQILTKYPMLQLKANNSNN